MSECGRKDHCCWFKGVICEYLVESPHPDFKFACLLRLRAESWDEVYQMPEYIRNIKPKMIEAGYKDVDCGDWPCDKCGTCGEHQ